MTSKLCVSAVDLVYCGFYDYFGHVNTKKILEKLDHRQGVRKNWADQIYITCMYYTCAGLEQNSMLL